MIKIDQNRVFRTSIILPLRLPILSYPGLEVPILCLQNAFLICPSAKNVRARSSNVGDVEQIMILPKKFRASCGSIFCRRTVFGIYFFGPVVVDWIWAVFWFQLFTRFEILPIQAAKHRPNADFWPSRVGWELNIRISSPASKCGA